MSGAIDSPGVVIIVLTSVMMILTSMERVSTPLMAVSKAMVAACEFFNVIDAPLPASGTLKLDPASLDLVFDDVTFEYPSRPGAKVLDSLAIRIRSGQNTALVGPSGSGKSTIVGLLERWYSLKGQHILPQVVEAKKPETPNDEKADESASGAEPVIPVLLGTVKVGDHDLEELDLRWWRSQIGLVQQEPFLFNDTIFGNVSNGLLGTEWEDEPEKRKRELVQEACQEAHAHEFVSNLPNVRAEFFVPSSSPPLLSLHIIALIFGWKLGLVASLVAMPILLASGYWKYRHEMYFDQMNSEVFKESSEFATEAIGAMRTVCSLTMETAINRRYQRLLDGHTQAAFRKALWTSGILGFTDSASLLCQSLVTWYGGRFLARGEYTMESFLVIFMAIIQGAEAASQALSIAPDMAQAKVAMDRLRSVKESTDVRRGENNENPLTGADGGVEIELQDVHFNYPTRDLPVFEGLSLSIEKGQYVAFVGPSGCGKTTVISLLERFYEPSQGAILCNGANVKDLDVYKYREALSLIAQEPTMFRGTIRDNILFGIADPGSFPAERLHQVCRDAFIYEFIVSLPEGYDTEVGQKGILLSGGQKQRIAIARALARDPKILLLDEATSALDSESEKMVQAVLEGARKGRTMIAVAHRLSTIQNADVIFVFDNGKVVEKGSHDELVSKQGVYWDMVRFPSISFFLGLVLTKYDQCQHQALA